MAVTNLIILQRVVPHYRVPLFERLHELYGWRVVCAANPPSGTGLELKLNAPWLVTREMAFPDARNEFKVQSDIGALVEDLKPDAIVAEFSLSANWTYTLAGRRLLRRGPKLAFWTHGYNFRRSLDAPKDISMQLARLPLLACADAVVCYSEDGARWVKSWLPRKPVIVAHNTLDIEKFPGRSLPMPRAAEGIHILSVGRMTPDKNFPMLVRVFRSLLEACPAAKFTLIGDGPDAGVVRELANLEIGRRIFLPGAIHDDASLAPYFRSADVFVYAGNIGLAANQALAYGVPILIFEQGKNGPRHSPEAAYVIEGQTGWRISPSTEDALLDRLIALAKQSPEMRATTRISAFNYANDNLRMEVMVRDFGQLNDIF
jgi:glycosyltransferase involved in cell wall biosynthesis